LNFFKLYIGDYQRDTGTLTLAEHGAYMLMLQYFYATEQALPSGRDLHRLLRAETKAERDAIDNVAAKFWRFDSSVGLVNDRALAEIKKREHQAAVNREAGKKGGRPRKGSTKPNGNRIGFQSENESDPIHNPNHSHSKPTSHDGNVGGGVGIDFDPRTGEIRRLA
jgi:uncharacterized protein YdaU (DUF1376 family)